MENEEIEAPYRIISLSEIGPLVMGKWSLIYVDYKCIGKPGDLSFKPSKYDYVPDTPENSDGRAVPLKYPKTDLRNTVSKVCAHLQH